MRGEKKKKKDGSRAARRLGAKACTRVRPLVKTPRCWLLNCPAASMHRHAVMHSAAWRRRGLYSQSPPRFLASSQLKRPLERERGSAAPSIWPTRREEPMKGRVSFSLLNSSGTLS